MWRDPHDTGFICAGKLGVTVLWAGGGGVGKAVEFFEVAAAVVEEADLVEEIGVVRRRAFGDHDTGGTAARLAGWAGLAAAAATISAREKISRLTRENCAGSAGDGGKPAPISRVIAVGLRGAPPREVAEYSAPDCSRRGGGGVAVPPFWTL